MGGVQCKNSGMVGSNMNNLDYRKRIYEKYASFFMDGPLKFDFAAAKRSEKIYSYFFRDWLPVRKDATILDVACGSGRLLYFFKQQGYTNLVGVDISPEQAQLAREVVKTVEVGDAIQFLKSHVGCFDLITGMDIIEHLHKDDALVFLESCYAAIIPGGSLILQSLNADSPWASAIRYGDLTHELCFGPRLLGQLLVLCGFSKVMFREQTPIPWGYSIHSTVRFVLWKFIRNVYRCISLVETGGEGSGCFSRTFLICGKK